MKILVTGGAGFIGSNLCLLLRNSGYEVAALDSFDSYYSVDIKRRNAAELSKKDIEVFERDLAEDDIGDVLNDIDSIVHLAAQPGLASTTSWEDYCRNNILATHRLIEAVKTNGDIRKLIFASSSSCYGRHVADSEEVAPKPVSWYGVTKLAAEQEILAAHRSGDLSACVVRPFSVYGERERPDKLFPKLIHSVATDQAFPLYEGSDRHRRSFSYVGDVCEGILKCIQNWDKAKGEIFNLGTEQSFTTGEGIRIVEDIMDKQAIVEIQPTRSGDQASTSANIDKARAILGWVPQTSLREGLERMIHWYFEDSRNQASG